MGNIEIRSSGNLIVYDYFPNQRIQNGIYCITC